MKRCNILPAETSPYANVPRHNGKSSETNWYQIQADRRRRIESGEEEEPISTVYFLRGVGSPANMWVKIGISRTPEVRAADIERHCPFKVEAVLCLPGTLTSERLLHERFARLRVKGEWFLYRGLLRKYVDDRI